MTGLIEKLRRQADSTSRASKLMAEAKDGSYQYLTPDQTVEWRAAAALEQAQSDTAKLRDLAQRLVEKCDGIDGDCSQEINGRRWDEWQAALTNMRAGLLSLEGK